MTDPTGPSVKLVELEPFDASTFDTWYAASAINHAADKVKAGNWPEAGAIERAVSELLRLLPEREKTAGNLLYTVRDAATEKKVGSLWLYYKPAATESGAYVFDLLIKEEERGKGYGAAALLAGESVVKGLGATSIGLHVFGFNKTAQNLYKKLGYEVTNLNMAKRF